MSRILGRSAPRQREESAADVAERVSDAALAAAQAAITAANAAIAAASTAVRLIDEREHKVVVLDPRPPVPADTAARLTAPPAVAGPAAPRVIHLPATAALPEQTGRQASSPPLSSRPLRGLAIALIVAGVLLLLDGVAALVWQEPISYLYATLRQAHLSGALKREEHAGPTSTERAALARLRAQSERIAYLAKSLQSHAGDGSPVGRIRIPSVGASFVIVNGTSTSALRSGPGIFPETTFPGVAGTTAIAGHRTTYLAPFRHIDELRSGDRILLDMPYADFTYTVTGHRVVPPSDVRDAVTNTGYARLVLSACTPLFSASKRLLVFARLSRTVAVRAGRTPA